MCGRLRARARVRKVAGKGVCVGVVCVVSSSYFLYRDGVLGCAGVLHLFCVRDGVLGFFVFFFSAPEISSEAFFWAPSSIFFTNAHTAKLWRWQVSHSALSFLLWFV